MNALFLLTFYKEPSEYLEANKEYYLVIKLTINC